MLNTTLCYVTRGNDVLMLHRIKKKNDLNQDKWIGIGGKFEEEQTPDECLLREAKEETGLTLTSWRCRGVVTFLTTGQWEGDKIFLDLLWSDAPFFLLKLRYDGDKLIEAVLNGEKLV